MSEKFCPVPFQNFEALWTGEVYLCCSAWVPVPVGNLKKSSALDIWNSGAAAAIRQSVLNGSYRYCSREFCAYLQGGALPDREEVTDPFLREVIGRGMTTLPRGPSRITLDIDRTCNLWCPSCRTTRVVLQGRELEEARLLQQKICGQLLGDARLLILSGSGDPFASRVHGDLLTGLDCSRYPDLKILIMTNGLLFTPERWDRMRRARGAVKMVVVSIDAATPGTYHTLRRGGNFGTLLKNLGFISGLRKGGQLDRLEFHFVVQLDNFLEMRQFVDLGRHYGADLVSFSRLCNWGSFTDGEYRHRAVHLRDHPDHPRFLQALRDPALKDPLVNLSSLSEFA